VATLGSVTVQAQDVADVWRELTAAETTVADKLLTRAAAILPSQSPGLLDRLTAGTVPPEAVEQVLIDSVIRVLRNPEGWKSGSRAVDDYRESFEWDERAAMAGLHFTAAELATLTGSPRSRGKAFTINTTPRY
jgi:hypothetical protein